MHTPSAKAADVLELYRHEMVKILKAGGTNTDAAIENIMGLPAAKGRGRFLFFYSYNNLGQDFRISGSWKGCRRGHVELKICRAVTVWGLKADTESKS